MEEFRTYASHDDPDYNSKTAAGCEESGEPCFTLRAQDVFAAATVRYWARAVAASDPEDPIVAKALAIAEAMEKWPTKKRPDL